MKNFVKILIFSIFAITTYAQQATEIDSKSVRLPRYASLAAIESAIPILQRQQGMMVYNIETASNWYYNGTAWTNTLGAVSAPLNLIYSTTPAISIGLDQTISGERIVNGDLLNPTLSPAYGVKGRVSGVGIAGAGVYGIGIGQNSGVYGTSDISYGLYGNSSESIGVHGSSNSGVGGYFRAGSIGSYPSNAALVGFSSLSSYSAIHGLMTGLGKAGLFEVNNSSNNLEALKVQTNGSYNSNSIKAVNTGLGGSGVFEINNESNSQSALNGSTNGTGYGVSGYSSNGTAGYFSSDPASLYGYNASLIGYSTKNDYKSIFGLMTGNGRAGLFEISNGSSTNVALEARTNGLGKAAFFYGLNALETNGSIKFGGSGVGTIAAGKVLTSDAVGNATWQAIPAVLAPLNLTHTVTPFQSTATGTTGNAGNFQITNASNSANALSSTTSGSGKAAYFQGTNALETDGTIKFGGAGVGTIAAGKVLTSDAVGNATWKDLVPYSKTLNESSDLLSITNTGTGGAGFFRINFSSNSNNAVHASTFGSGSAIYGFAESINGNAGTFESENSFPTLKSTNYGTGKAANFEIDFSGNSSNTLQAVTNGTGKAAYFQGTNALETDGTIKFGGSGVGTIAAGKVLTSDAVGNATWQSIPEVTGPLTLTSTTTTMSSTATGTVGNASNFNISNVSNPSNGISVSTLGTGKAISATNNSSTNPTITAVNNTNLGNALDITGGIKVSGTNKAAFKITTITGLGGNTTSNVLTIPNTTLANNTNDILIVTHNFSPNNTYLNKAYGVFWTSTNWAIYLEDGSTMPNNITFNILVIKQ